MAIHKELKAHCPRCDKDVDFQIDLYYVDYNGIMPCFVCPECKAVVPEYSFSRFLQTGKVFIGV